MRAPDKRKVYWNGKALSDDEVAEMDAIIAKSGVKQHGVSRTFIQVLSFSEAADWSGIKQSLADCGVELDATKVGKFVPGKRWWLPDDSGVRHSLRHELERMAWHYTDPFLLEKPSTPAQVAQVWQKPLAALEEAFELLERAACDNNYYTDDDFVVDQVAFDAIMRQIDKLKERIAKLRAMPSPRVQNARTRHNDYWRELTRLWLGITGSAGPLRRKRLHSFLTACTPPGLFPDMTTQRLAHKIDGFISNLSRKQPRPPESRGA